MYCGGSLGYYCSMYCRGSLGYYCAMYCRGSLGYYCSAGGEWRQAAGAVV
jgi:hypothetical protein